MSCGTEFVQRGGCRTQNDYFSLMQRLAPDLAQEIERRALVLERIGALQPVGRRQLATRLNLPEREVRTVATLLKQCGLIRLDAAGMSLTAEAEDVLPSARLFSRELRGLTGLEMQLCKVLHVDKVCVVAGDADLDAQVLREVGRSAANRLRSYLQSGSTIAVTGGTTMREVAEAVPTGSPVNVMVVPARGGLGEALEIQANTIASLIASRLGGHHRLIHLPDELDEQSLNELRKLSDVDEALMLLARADVVLHGIGTASEMIRRRQLSFSTEQMLLNKGAIAEAYGCYFSLDGKAIYSASNVAHDLGALKPNCAMLAVAAGKSKAQAIIAIMRDRHHSLLVTDEGAAKAILQTLH